MDQVENRPYHALKAIPGVDKLILDKIGSGMSLKAIGEELGVTDTAIFNRAMQYPEYKAKLNIGAELRMDRREEELEKAETNVDVTRADRLLGHARWIAERTCPDRFGNKQLNVNVNFQAISIQAALDEAHGRLIEAEANHAAIPSEYEQVIDK